MTIMINCGTGGRQAPNYKLCRIYDDASKQNCTLEAEHDPAGLYVRVACDKSVRGRFVNRGT
jgi:hypothetical protein